MQLISVRTNQDFGVNHENGKLIPQTEVILLIEKPKYVIKGDIVKRSSEVSEMRFKCGTNGINELIGKLQLAQSMAASYEQMAGALNEIILKSKPEGK